MRIGGVYLYKERYPVYITGGAYERNGRVSNYWKFQHIKKDGQLGKKGGDYDNGGPEKFCQITGAKVKTLIKLPSRVWNRKKAPNRRWINILDINLQQG